MARGGLQTGRLIGAQHKEALSNAVQQRQLRRGWAPLYKIYEQRLWLLLGKLLEDWASWERDDL